MTGLYGPVEDWATDLEHAEPEYHRRAHGICDELRDRGCPVAHTGRPIAPEPVSPAPHRCLGSNRARLELKIAIEEFVNRFPSFALDGDVRWSVGQICGARVLPIRILATD